MLEISEDSIINILKISNLLIMLNKSNISLKISLIYSIFKQLVSINKK